MNYRERFLNVLRGKAVDRLPFVEYAGDPYSMVMAYSDWGQHLPANADLRQFFGFDNAFIEPKGSAAVPLDPYAVPRFPDRKLAPIDGYPREAELAWGCVARYRPPAEADGFPIRVFEDYAVKSRDDWHQIRDERFRLTTDGRFPDDWLARCQDARQSGAPIILNVPAPESGLWGLLGEEEGDTSILMGFHCHPELMREIAAHLGELYLMCLEKALCEGIVDMLTICGSDLWTLIGPEVMTEFFMPYHVRALALARRYNVDLACLVTRVPMRTAWIDLFIDAGVTGIRMAEETGDDYVVKGLIEHCGRDLFHIGNLDGRVLTGGLNQIGDEVERGLEQAAEQRIVPSLHVNNIPPAVPFKSYAHYVDFLRQGIFG